MTLCIRRFDFGSVKLMKFLHPKNLISTKIENMVCIYSFFIIKYEHSQSSPAILLFFPIIIGRKPGHTVRKSRNTTKQNRSPIF